MCRSYECLQQLRPAAERCGHRRVAQGEYPIVYGPKALLKLPVLSKLVLRLSMRTFFMLAWHTLS